VNSDQQKAKGRRQKAGGKGGQQGDSLRKHVDYEKGKIVIGVRIETSARHRAT